MEQKLSSHSLFSFKNISYLSAGSDRGDIKMHCVGNLEASGTANKVTAFGDDHFGIGITKPLN